MHADFRNEALARGRRARLLAGAAALVAVVGILLARRGVEPIATWLYLASWYPTLLVLEALIASREGGPSLLGRSRYLISLLGWSAVFWFGFELLNFRLANWYYIFLPGGRAERWVGTVLAFATVLPAVFLAARALEAWRLPGRVAVTRLVVTPRALRLSTALGVIFLALPMAWPTRFFPLVWGAATLLAEPVLYRRARHWSLLGDLERGEAGRIARLLIGGAAAGLIWEFYNSFARSRWIYTVPWLEDLKLFEMPLLGFIGFPVFALECWSVYHLLASWGVAVPEREAAPAPYRHGPGPVVAPSGTRTLSLRGRRTLLAAAGAAAFSVLVLLGMERFTISSTRPALGQVPGLPAVIAARLSRDGASPFALAAASAEDLARRVGSTVQDAAAWIETARLVTLRGIGAVNATRLADVGVPTVQALAEQPPEELAARLNGGGPAGAGRRPSAAEVRVWVRAALGAVNPPVE